MDNLYLVIWSKPRRPKEFWLDPPASGYGRLVAALAVIGVAAWLLDHVATAGKTDTAAFHDASAKGSSK